MNFLDVSPDDLCIKPGEDGTNNPGWVVLKSDPTKILVIETPPLELCMFKTLEGDLGDDKGQYAVERRDRAKLTIGVRVGAHITSLEEYDEQGRRRDIRDAATLDRVNKELVETQRSFMRWIHDAMSRVVEAEFDNRVQWSKPVQDVYNETLREMLREKQCKSASDLSKDDRDELTRRARIRWVNAAHLPLDLSACDDQLRKASPTGELRECAMFIKRAVWKIRPGRFSAALQEPSIEELPPTSENFREVVNRMAAKYEYGYWKFYQDGECIGPPEISTDGFCDEAVKRRTRMGFTTLPMYDPTWTPFREGYNTLVQLRLMFKCFTAPRMCGIQCVPTYKIVKVREDERLDVGGGGGGGGAASMGVSRPFRHLGQKRSRETVITQSNKRIYNDDDNDDAAYLDTNGF